MDLLDAPIKRLGNSEISAHHLDVFADQVPPRESGYSWKPRVSHLESRSEAQPNEMRFYSGMTSIALIEG